MRMMQIRSRQFTDSGITVLLCWFGSAMRRHNHALIRRCTGERP